MIRLPCSSWLRVGGTGRNGFPSASTSSVLTALMGISRVRAPTLASTGPRASKSPSNAQRRVMGVRCPLRPSCGVRATAVRVMPSGCSSIIRFLFLSSIVDPGLQFLLQKSPVYGGVVRLAQEPFHPFQCQHNRVGCAVKKAFSYDIAQETDILIAGHRHLPFNNDSAYSTKRHFPCIRDFC